MVSCGLRTYRHVCVAKELVDKKLRNKNLWVDFASDYKVERDWKLYAGCSAVKVVFMTSHESLRIFSSGFYH